MLFQSIWNIKLKAHMLKINKLECSKTSTTFILAVLKNFWITYWNPIQPPLHQSWSNRQFLHHVPPPPLPPPLPAVEQSNVEFDPGCLFSWVCMISGTHFQENPRKIQKAQDFLQNQGATCLHKWLFLTSEKEYTSCIWMWVCNIFAASTK